MDKATSEREGLTRRMRHYWINNKGWSLECRARVGIVIIDAYGVNKQGYMSKALIVYGTRTEHYNHSPRNCFSKARYETKVVDAKEKIKSVAEYDLIVVSNGIQWSLDW